MIVRFNELLKSDKIAIHLHNHDFYEEIMSSLIFFINEGENVDKYKNYTILA